MKKLTFSFLSISLLLAACTPQAGPGIPVPAPSTLASTATPTPTPSIIPTPTDFRFAETLAALSTSTTTPAPSASTQPDVLRLERLQMIDANVGWGEGRVSSAGQPITYETPYHLLRTTDGGETWQDVTPPVWFSPPGHIADITVFAIDADTALAFPPDYLFSEDPPYMLVWRTTDGGKSWRPGNPIDVSDSSLLLGVSPRPQFVDEKHGWLTLYFGHRSEAYYLDYRTHDGGITWEQMESCHTWDSGPGGAPLCETALFTDAQTGWRDSPPDYTSTGEEDLTTVWRVQRTLDGGAAWQIIDLPQAREGVYCYQNFAEARAGTIGIRVTCYTSLGEERYYYLSADQGQSWQIIPLPETVSTTGQIFFLDSTTGWRISVSGSGYQLERTLDSGVTWQAMGERLDWQAGFQFVDANTGWVVSSDGLQRTTDGGKTWVKLAARFLPATPNEPTIVRLETGHPLVFKSIRMIDSSNGWAVGADGYVFRTGDGGKTWQDVTPLYGYISAQRELFVLDVWRAWTTVSFPAYETIWSTSDGGQSWHQIFALSNRQIVSAGSIRFLNENTGWFQWSQTGQNPQLVYLMKTRNNGIAWEIQSTGQYSYDYSARNRMGFMFLNEQSGLRIEPVKGQTLEEFLSDSPPLISKTTDGGVTWQPVDLPPMVIDADKISPDPKAWPGGVKDLMQDSLSCNGKTTLHVFSPDTIGLGVICKAVREISSNNYYDFLLSEYYLSTDAGASWSNWMSARNGIASQDGRSEFFLPGGIGWRLGANQLLQTTDGGKTWTTIKAVGWDKAQFDFINAQEGWGIVKSGHAISFVHTSDGGKTWEVIKPVITP